MNKQRVMLYFSLRLGNLASNYRICLTVPGGLRRPRVSLQSSGLLRSVRWADTDGVGVGSREGTSAAKGREGWAKST